MANHNNPIQISSNYLGINKRTWQAGTYLHYKNDEKKNSDKLILNESNTDIIVDRIDFPMIKKTVAPQILTRM